MTFAEVLDCCKKNRAEVAAFTAAGYFDFTQGCATSGGAAVDRRDFSLGSRDA